MTHGEREHSADGIAGGLDTDVENVFPEQTGQDAPSLGADHVGRKRRGAARRRTWSSLPPLARRSPSIWASRSATFSPIRPSG